MSIKHLGRSAHRFVLERLEQLQASLEGLGQRLRESIAHLVGIHVGQAIRDSIGSVLMREPAEKVAERFDDYERDRRASEEDEEDPIWGRPLSPPESEDKTRQSLGPLENAPDGGGSGRLGVASASGAPCRSLCWLVGLGTLAGLVTLATGPLVGGVVTTAVTAYLVTRGSANETQS